MKKIKEDIEIKKLKRFFVMFEGKELGMIKARSFEDARNRIEEVVTIEIEEE